MDDVERQQTIDECRRYSYAANTVLPLLEKQKKLALDQLMGRYRDGKTEFIDLIAMLYSISQMEREFTIREQMLRTLEEKC